MVERERAEVVEGVGVRPASDVYFEDNQQKKDELIEETGKEFGVSAEKSKEWYFDAYIASELSNEEEDDDEDYNDEEEEDIDDDEEEEEEDLLVDHYGEDLTREEREELMMKDIEKAQDKSELLGRGFATRIQVSCNPKDNWFCA